jgi:hypothetical protein
MGAPGIVNRNFHFPKGIGNPMSKQTVKIEEVRYIPFGRAKTYADVGWLPELNVRKQYDKGDGTDDRKTRDMLATQLGWDPQYPIIGEVASEEELEKHLARREAAHAEYKRLCNDDKLSDDEKELRDAAVTIPRNGSTYKVKGRDWAEARLASYEWLYCTKSGGYRRPIVTGTTGNRRGSQVVDAVAVQLINARLDEGNPKLQPHEVEDRLTCHISVIVPDTEDHRFPDVAVRMQAQIRENTTKTAGFKPMEESEHLEAVLDLVENFGKSQSDIRNSGYGATYGLRLYFTAVIDNYCRIQASDHSKPKEERKAWKAIRLLDRFIAPPFTDKEGKVPNDFQLDFKQFSQKAFQGGDEAAGYLPMGLMCETDSKFDRENRRRAGLAKPKPVMNRPTPQVVSDWIALITEKGAPAPKPVMKRDKIKDYASKHTNPFVRLAMKAVDKADEGIVAPLSKKADVCNYVFGTSDDVYAKLAEVTGLLDEIDDEAVVIHILEQVIASASEAVAASAEGNDAPVEEAVEADAS